MKGMNKMTVNQATMCEALQEWLDRKFVMSPGIVTQVEATNSAGHYDANLNFEIRIEEPGTGMAINERNAD